MLLVKKEGVLLKKKGGGYESKGVMNPACIQEGEYVHLFYRAVTDDNYSSIGYCRLYGPLTVIERRDLPILTRDYDYESHGVEDPRIVMLDSVYLLTYTAYDGVNALGALATSTDLVHFEKKGILVPQISYKDFDAITSVNGVLNEKYHRYNEKSWGDLKDGRSAFISDKNVIFYSSRINGKIYFLHRIKPDIQIVAVYDLKELTNKFWEDYFLHFDQNIILSPKYEHEVSYVGGGCPPIKTDVGWLLIYHGVKDSIQGYIYSACAALFELENPAKEIARLPYPLFEPDQVWELMGEVENVCFPTGSIVSDGILYIYYGAADEQIACASVSLEMLLNELLRHS